MKGLTKAEQKVEQKVDHWEHWMDCLRVEQSEKKKVDWKADQWAR